MTDPPHTWAAMLGSFPNVHYGLVEAIGDQLDTLEVMNKLRDKQDITSAANHLHRSLGTKNHK